MAWVYITLLLQLCTLTALGQDVFAITETDGTDDYYYYDDVTEIPAEDFDSSLNDWLYELLDITDDCDPNPCLNGGRCDTTADGGFVCSCPEPYTGKKCQTVKDVCKNAKCGHGSCVVTSTAPFYECKCKPPYRPPNCNKAASCRPNPCQNGGSCMKGPKRSTFQCSCPAGYSGKFCEIGSNDCYREDGESYRGMVSETVEGEECLDWNSYFIVQKGGDPFKEYAGFDGIGPHNYCSSTHPTSNPTRSNYSQASRHSCPVLPVRTATALAACPGSLVGRSLFLGLIHGRFPCRPDPEALMGPSATSVEASSSSPAGCSLLHTALIMWREKKRKEEEESLLKLPLCPLQGDSGGPLVCERNGTHYVVGVVSWGDGCGNKYKPGVYANVGRFVDWIAHEYEEYSEMPVITPAMSDWLFELLNETGVCDPNPCLNGGSCLNKNDTDFTCLCPEPYIGIRCQQVSNLCENVKCGFGDCVVNLNKAPYYECKCKHLYQGPDCKQTPSDCYDGDGETYRGSVSVTESGLNCLDWHSYFILANSDDPFTIYSEFTGLEYNNHCRNPDGDDKPWCFIKKEGKLEWEHCKIKMCSEALLKLQNLTDSPYCAMETNFVKAACLPSHVFPTGKECVISGWGATKKEEYSSKLMNARVFLISDERCSAPDIYGSILDSSMLCAGILQGGIDSCQGDSGGPLVCEENGTNYVTGVVSWGDDCGLKNKPGVYANVHRFIGWIKSKIYS
ncbi:Hyaluronan-binding protein 2 [Larimichthys crocea]|uniref:Uncharacterized protein n=1 Tax=Larimichthys crocea TaxID=215358 RepID=A0ACD3RTB5_LARCR|nr:Hyaluronan-binding protein 2 [Larimichthys crocea]